MKTITWFKIRALLFAHVQKLFGLVLWIPVPPKVSVGCFIEKDGKLLVLDLSYRSGYAFPGGLIEPGEDVETALRREVHEETGLAITSLTYLASAHDIQYGLSVLAIAFTAEVSGVEVASTEGALLWVSPEEIQNNQAYNNWSSLLTTYLQTKV